MIVLFTYFVLIISSFVFQMDPLEEIRDSKRQLEYLNHLGNVADSEYGMPIRCACGGRMIDELRVKDEFDTQPGKRFFSCVNYEVRYKPVLPFITQPLHY